MKRNSILLSALLLLPIPVLAQVPIRGFPASSVAEQRAREQRMHAVPSPDSLRARMRLLSEFPHEAGTERSRQVAEMILARFKSFGLDARIERFEALMPRPTERQLELIAPERYVAKLKEPQLPEDKDSGDPDQLPTYNAYSPDGDVTGEVVFVNYGVPDDYRVLDSLGISVRGKIVLAKYGRSWRGIKPKVAAERGAIATIIYSDPRDDGFFVGDVYPKGSMRPAFGVQRGSVMDMPTYPGDPASPGWASEAGSRRLPFNEMQDLRADSRAADFVRGCAADSAQPRWCRSSGCVEGRVADHVSLRTGSRTGASAPQVRVGNPTAIQCHRPCAGRARSRSVDHLRQSSRRVGERRRRSDQRDGGAGGSCTFGRASC